MFNDIKSEDFAIDLTEDYILINIVTESKNQFIVITWDTFEIESSISYGEDLVISSVEFVYQNDRIYFNVFDEDEQDIKV